MVITAALQHRMIVVWLDIVLPEGHSDMFFWLFGGFLYQIDSLKLFVREAFGGTCIFLLGMGMSIRSRKSKDTSLGALIIAMSASGLVCP